MKIGLVWLVFLLNNFSSMAQCKVGFTFGLASYDIPKDINNNLVAELEVLNSSYASLFLEANLKNDVSEKNTINYSLGYLYAVLSFGLPGLSDRIGDTLAGRVASGYQRNAADYKLHYVTIGCEFEHFFKEKYKGFSVAAGPRIHYQLVNNHLRSRLLETKEVIALPIVDKQKGLNKLAADINMTISYGVIIKSTSIILGFQNAIRIRSFYSDISLGINRFFNRGIFIRSVF